MLLSDFQLLCASKQNILVNILLIMPSFASFGNIIHLDYDELDWFWCSCIKRLRTLLPTFIRLFLFLTSHFDPKLEINHFSSYICHLRHLSIWNISRGCHIRPVNAPCQRDRPQILICFSLLKTVVSSFSSLLIGQTWQIQPGTWSPCKRPTTAEHLKEWYFY